MGENLKENTMENQKKKNSLVNKVIDLKKTNHMVIDQNQNNHMVRENKKTLISLKETKMVMIDFKTQKKVYTKEDKKMGNLKENIMENKKNKNFSINQEID